MSGLVGIMGDTHDNLELTRKALKVLVEKGVSTVLHTGDVISPFTAKLLVKSGLKIHLVWGNNDGDKVKLAEILAKGGGEVHGEYALLTINNKRVFLTHYVPPQLLEGMLRSGACQVAIYGHTHKPEVKKVGGGLLLNPGEVCGYLHGKSTVIILNLEKLEAQVLTLT